MNLFFKDFHDSDYQQHDRKKAAVATRQQSRDHVRVWHHAVRQSAHRARQMLHLF